MATNVNTRPTTSAEARKRPSKANAKPKTKASVRFTIRELRDRCVAQLLGAAERIVRTQGCTEIEQAATLRSELYALENPLTLAQRDLDGMPRPQAGDPVRAEVRLTRGKRSEWCCLYGKVLCCGDLGDVPLRYQHYESDDGANWDREIAKYLNKDFIAHAAQMERDAGDEEWTVDGPILASTKKTVASQRDRCRAE